MRIGTGWDFHPLTEGRELVIGGITIPFPKGEAGHSDGDVLIHAVIDSLLGALALGDIGTHFPPSDPAFKNIASTLLLEKVIGLIHTNGFFVGNLDTTVILQKPKLKEYIPRIQENLSLLLNVSPGRISVKAKTNEKMDAVGRGEAVEAQAVVLLEEKDESVWV